jgi:hypothetical protein
MVDALHEARIALRPGGTLIDLRPDSSHPPRVVRDGADVGGLYEHREAIGDNRASDRAVARVVRDGLLTPVRAGSFWYDTPYPDLPSLDAWLETSTRIGGYTRGTRGVLRKDRGRPLTVRRALAFGIYRRTEG